MITITWGTAMGFAALIALAGPMFYKLGRISKQVETNTGNIKNLYTKIEVIHQYVKNGGGKK